MSMNCTPAYSESSLVLKKIREPMYAIGLETPILVPAYAIPPFAFA